jgi:hypothetical protein
MVPQATPVLCNDARVAMGLLSLVDVAGLAVLIVAKGAERRRRRANHRLGLGVERVEAPTA